MTKEHSIYLHIPFCRKRCSYCDFNTFSGINSLIPKYVDELENEIKLYGKKYSGKLPVKTIFFGGGTPSLISIKQYKSLLQTITSNFNVKRDVELSLEANPGTVSLDYLTGLKEIGFNRVSFGLQTSNPFQLELLGRIHNHFQSIQAIKWAKQAGFKNINIDLIYGLPNQTLDDWKKVLQDGLNLDTQHISLYALGIEEGTPLFDWVKKGLVEEPDPDLAADMFEAAEDILVNNGFESYEISNYFKKDKEFDYRCHHNLQYWRNLPYLGFGAGAHGFYEKVRYENVNGVGEYINLMKNNIIDGNMESPVKKNETKIDQFTEMQETMMVGLRLVSEGVSIEKFQKRFGDSPLVVFQKEINQLLKDNLIEITDDSVIRLQSEARLIGNLVFQKFVN